MPKASRVDFDRRVETVKQLLVAGVDLPVIRQDMAQRYDVSVRQIERYLAEARKRLYEYVAIDRAAMFAEHVAHRRDMRRRARQANDMRIELAVAQDEAKLFGLYAAEEQRLNVSGGLTAANVVIYLPDNARGDDDTLTVNENAP